MKRIFLLSPATVSGKRGSMLLNPRADFPLAQRLSSGVATIGETFSFLSGIYFRGKLTYAKCFAMPPPDTVGIHIITAGRGLLPETTPLAVADIQGFAQVEISLENEQYRAPLEQDLLRLSNTLTHDTQVVLLGSVATGKYVEPLLEHFGRQLFFPEAFIGKGDMSRGSLLLKAASDGRELSYRSLYPIGIHRRSELKEG